MCKSFQFPQWSLVKATTISIFFSISTKIQMNNFIQRYKYNYKFSAKIYLTDNHILSSVKDQRKQFMESCRGRIYVLFGLLYLSMTLNQNHRKQSNLILVKSSDLSVNQSGISRTIRTSCFR